MVSESPGRNASEPIMASKGLNTEGRALTYRAKAAWSVARTDAAKHFGGVGRDSTVTRSCQATGETLLVPSRNRRSKETV